MSSKRVMTPVFRVFFPAVFEPKDFDGDGKFKYSLQMVWPEGTDLSELEDLVMSTAKDKWGNKLPAKWKNPLRSGDLDRSDKPGYEGTTFATASSKFQPGLVDAKVKPIIDQSEFYPGCYARATVSAYAFEFKGNVGVAFNLCNVQKVKDGQRIDGRKDAGDEFSSLEEFNPDETLN